MRIIATLLLGLLPCLVAAQQVSPRVTTVGNLPPACTTGQPYIVSDGASSSDCSTGSGSTIHLCFCNAAGTGYDAQPGGAPGTDSVGTTELDDDANSPTAGYAVVVETGAASFDYAELAAAPTASGFMKWAEPGNTISTVTLSSVIYIDAAACVGATASNNWDDAGTGDTAPTAACNDTGSIQRPSADFSGSAVNSFERTIRLPSDWTGNVDVTLRYVSTAASPTGNVEWDISTVCRAAGESWDGSFNAAQTITDAQTTQNVLNDATQATVTMTGCAAGEDWTLKVSRDGTNDSSNDTANLLGVEITIERDVS